MKPWARMRAGLALLAALLVMTLLGVARAEPMVLSASTREVRVGARAEVLEDPSRALTIDDVAGGAARARFAPITRSDLGYQRSAFWVRLSVVRDADAPAAWVLALCTPSRAALFTPRSDGGYGVKVSGTALPFSTREIADWRISFHIEPPASRPTTYYLRLEFEDTALVEPELRSETAHAEKLAVESLGHGLYFGVILALVAYNALLFAITRDRASFMYVFFELAFVFTMGSMDKLTFEYLWPGSPVWAARSEQVFLCAALFGALGFARSFLSLPTTAPRLSRAYTWLMAGALLLGCAGAASMAPALLTAIAAFFFACVGAVLGTGVLLVRRRMPNAATYLAAFALLLLGGFTQGLASIGVLDFSEVGLPTKIGSLAEATLLSLGLARRVNQIRRDRARAQARLSRARTERMAALGRLVAGFAHEIGNPLNFVLGGAAEAAALLEEADAAPGSERSGGLAPGEALGAARQAVRLVVEGGERMKRTLDNVRCYSRASDVEPVATDVVAGVRSTLALAAPLLERTRTSVSLDLAEVPAVEARPGEIEQVFMNLVVNACQAMTGPGGELSITVSKEGERVQVMFADTGPGIPESQREAVFEPFFTTREGRGGTGLGLYVSSDLVTRNGGELRIEESVTGARFVVSLPCARS
jgi:signal transduction histidine kinase